MIDYEKLKQAHELCEKLANQEEFVSFTYDFFYCKKEGNRMGVNLLLGPDHPEFQEGFYHIENLDPLIARLQELTNPKPKYKVGDKVWIHSVTIGDNKVHEATIKHIYGNKNCVIEYINTFIAQVEEEILYPSKQSLIEAQIGYWTCLKNQEKSTNNDHMSIAETECVHESDGISYKKGFFNDGPLYKCCIKCYEIY